MNDSTIIGFLKARVLTITLIIAALVIVYLGIGRISDWWNAGANESLIRELYANLAVQRELSDKALKREAELATENDLLRQTNEKQAEALKESADAQTRKDGEAIEAIHDRLEKKLEDIDATEASEQKTKLCEEARAAGIDLVLCKRVVQ